MKEENKMPTYSHFAARVRYMTKEEKAERNTAIAREMRRARLKDEEGKLKAAGFDSMKVFKHLDGDKEAEAKAQSDAEAYAKKFTDLTGVELIVSPGFFM
jgi:hypothetical protein